MDLAGKHIVLGLTGGVACYKSAELCRLLVKAGASVRSKALVGSHATRYTVTAEGPVSAGR